MDYGPWMRSVFLWAVVLFGPAAALVILMRKGRIRIPGPLLGVSVLLVTSLTWKIMMSAEWYRPRRAGEAPAFRRVFPPGPEEFIALSLILLSCLALAVGVEKLNGKRVPPPVDCSYNKSLKVIFYLLLGFTYISFIIFAFV